MLKVYSQDNCVNCDILKSFLNENKINYEEVDVNSDFTASAFMIMNDVDVTPAVYDGNQILSGDVDLIKENIMGRLTV